MFASNPFAALTETISAEMIQGYVILMAILVVGMTIYDMIHKKSAKYFFAKAKQAEANRVRELGAGDKIGIAVKVATVDVATAGEFCNPMRRISHMLMMWGFILFIVSTVALTFAYTGEAPAIVAQLWHLGAIMVMVGGYWFWFFIRVDVSAEAVSLFRIVQADLFILSLLGTTTFGLLWSIMQSKGDAMWTTIFLALFIISATFLFGGVLWSKFAHMFFKPAAAFNKRVIKADGSRENLPEDFDLTSSEIQKRYPDIPEYMGTNPSYMGLGIKREKPKHY
ncbi:hypothetical protein V5T82_11445 [Magnetovibrio sp. PR-2]|uniref:hypothetical protein n=1 Tax=Magnetovibrio sp. PR-2 TaxID=3120356 RepID=UPI002FCE4907